MMVTILTLKDYNTKMYFPFNTVRISTFHLVWPLFFMLKLATVLLNILCNVKKYSSIYDKTHVYSVTFVHPGKTNYNFYSTWVCNSTDAEKAYIYKEKQKGTTDTCLHIVIDIVINVLTSSIYVLMNSMHIYKTITWLQQQQKIT